MTPTLHFGRAEFAARVDKTKKAMEKAGLDALVVSDPSNMAWLTGYDGWSFYVHQAVVLPLDDDPVWFGRSQDANGAKRTAWLGWDRIESYPDHYVQSTERHPMQVLAEIIGRRGWDKRRIGARRQQRDDRRIITTGLLGAECARVEDFGDQLVLAQARFDGVENARVHLLDDARRLFHIFELLRRLHRALPVH